MLLAGIMTASLSACCSDDELISSASAEDDPRIIDPVFPERQNGQLATFATISRDNRLNMTLTVTPADYTSCTWYIDGQLVAEGKEIDRQMEAGTYNLKIVATTTAGKSTSREGIVIVNPLDADPVTTRVGYEQFIAPGTVATLYGRNLDQIEAITIGGVKVTDISLEKTSDGEKMQYLVPEGLKDSLYRVSLVAKDGTSYGGGQVQVTDRALVTSGANRSNANSEWTITGINLDKVASLTVGDKSVTSFISQSSDRLTLICPALAEGEYNVTGVAKDGSKVTFYIADGISEQQTVVISSERTLWEGHHYVSWDKPDGDPNKTFNLIDIGVFAGMKPGAILTVYYSVEASAEYHQMKLVSGWWTDLPGTTVQEFSADGSYTVKVTQDALDMINSQSGFLIVGHGYYVDRVTLQ